jgi:hypothetical protein
LTGIEENFEEAIKNVNNSIVPTQVNSSRKKLSFFQTIQIIVFKIPFEIKKLFEDEKCLNINANVRILFKQW